MKSPYANGWRPTGVFDVIPASGFDFGAALVHLHSGTRVTRAGWNGKGMWLALQSPDAGSKMTRPYIYMHTADGGLVPWLASQSDLLATDWQVPTVQRETVRKMPSVGTSYRVKSVRNAVHEHLVGKVGVCVQVHNTGIDTTWVSLRFPDGPSNTYRFPYSEIEEQLHAPRPNEA